MVAIETALKFVFVVGLGFLIGIGVAFVLDGFHWKGLSEVFDTGLASAICGTGAYYLQKRKKA